MSQHEVNIEKWVYGGEGLARIDGKVALVPHVLPGETVRIEPNVVDDESAASAPAKFLSVFIVEKGKPLAVPVP